MPESLPGATTALREELAREKALVAADDLFRCDFVPLPLSLAQRVLAALEQEASNHDEYDSRYEYDRATLLRALAAELRAYIAERERGGKK